MGVQVISQPHFFRAPSTVIGTAVGSMSALSAVAGLTVYGQISANGAVTCAGLTANGQTTIRSLAETNNSVNVISNTLTLDLGQYTYFKATLSANVNSITLLNVPTGVVSFTLKTIQDSTGGRTVNFNFTGRTTTWPGGTAPSVTGIPNKSDTYLFVSDDGAGAVWDGYISSQNR